MERRFCNRPREMLARLPAMGQVLRSENLMSFLDVMEKSQLEILDLLKVLAKKSTNIPQMVVKNGHLPW